MLPTLLDLRCRQPQPLMCEVEVLDHPRALCRGKLAACKQLLTRSLAGCMISDPVRSDRVLVQAAPVVPLAPDEQQVFRHRDFLRAAGEQVRKRPPAALLAEIHRELAEGFGSPGPRLVRLQESVDDLGVAASQPAGEACALEPRAEHFLVETRHRGATVIRLERALGLAGVAIALRKIERVA